MQEAKTILAVHTGLTKQKVDVDLVRKCNETTKKNLTNNLNEFKKRTFEHISRSEEKIRKLESEVTSIRKDLKKEKEERAKWELNLKKEKEERAKWCNEVASLLILQGIDAYVKEKCSNITQSLFCSFSKELIQNDLDLMEKAESLKKKIKSFPEKLKKSSIQDLTKTEMTEDELQFCKLINVNFNNFVNHSLDNEDK
ncbi:hypothetical protein ABK040_000090 [Willaertia magna]